METLTSSGLQLEVVYWPAMWYADMRATIKRLQMKCETVLLC